jgi:GTP cyclohydrolase II
VHVVERVPCEVDASPHAQEYLKTKKEKLGHLFTSSQ